MITKSNSLPPSPKRSLFNQFKSFINQKLDQQIDEDEGMSIFNEATQVINLKRANLPIQQKQIQMNQTQPVLQNKFEIGNDQKNELSERVFDIDEEQPEVIQTQNEKIVLDGYSIFEVKELNHQSSIKMKPIEPYGKKQTIQFPPQSAFHATKASKKYSSLIDYFKKDIERYAAIDGGWFYILEKKGHDVFRVKSVIAMNRLTKIFLKENQKKPHIRLAFNNDGNFKIKCFTLHDYETLFFLKLKNEIQKYDLTF